MSLGTLIKNFIDNNWNETIWLCALFTGSMMADKDQIWYSVDVAEDNDYGEVDDDVDGKCECYFNVADCW